MPQIISSNFLFPHSYDKRFSSNDSTCYFLFISQIKIYEVIEIFARVALQKARLYAD